jgi:hypothetical protein
MPHRGPDLFPPDLAVVHDPVAQALLTIYDRSEGRPDRTRATNWIWFGDRMNYITNLMRSRQQHEDLFRQPFAPEVIDKLLRGELAGDSLDNGVLPDLFTGVTDEAKGA